MLVFIKNALNIYPKTFITFMFNNSTTYLSPITSIYSTQKYHVDNFIFNYYDHTRYLGTKFVIFI